MFTIQKRLRTATFIVIMLALAGCAQSPGSEQQAVEQIERKLQEEQVEHQRGEALTLDAELRDGEWWISARQLAEITQGSIEVDDLNGTVELDILGVPFFLIKEVTVVERNGLYLPYELEPLFTDEDVLLPAAFLTQALEAEYELLETDEKVQLWLDDEAIATFSQHGQTTSDLKALSADDLINYLSFLSNPIPGAQISTRESHLPGAPRPYRNGYHEGIDWYAGVTGIDIGLDTPVLSVADGIVVRADNDYVEMDLEERESYLSWAAQLSDTPTYILDKLRGRSVWVQYDHGVMIRYVHLSAVEEGIEVGKEVKRGDVLGYVGNSGTSFAVKGDEYGGLHLHADLLIYGELFWKHLDHLDEVRYVLEHIFQDEPKQLPDAGD
ncbi:murein DD-endopeptidase MepM/ murein hydrolase activator NlpD [Caldalkalibacillus uzonensis]|uniref:Murein DD-endopeptidase MepM/ murein hydrolase activator NlpD n=1 Tax=Caldalkalibacillus uzonensis TaxID=353224 RepID=A0ABU0CV46_9BACI|nr:M23 family metallopeptidase [Caldalkalibacillus uzonensis]MDQ0340297.1 murein DD-endopeptidase MepM/ murein hydrolase activator NlpD [Caldalkalibacillus uzonensis]